MAYSAKILAFAGSARKASFNKRLAKIAAEGARKAGAHVTYLDFLDLPIPLFNEDYEASLQPNEEPNAKKFKDLLRAHDGFLISSPENNGSYSALTKNVFDWVSRKRTGEQPFECTANKTVVVMSASPGALGGMRGLFQFRYLLQIFRCNVLSEQVTVPHADQAFNDDGSLKDASQQASAERLGAVLAQTLAKLKA